MNLGTYPILQELRARGIIQLRALAGHLVDLRAKLVNELVHSPPDDNQLRKGQIQCLDALIKDVQAAINDGAQDGNS